MRITATILTLLLMTLPAVAQQQVIEEVIVKINDEMITLSEFEEAFAPVRRQIEARSEGAEQQERLQNFKKMIFNIMVNKRLLRVKFNELGVSVPQQQYAEVTKYFMEQTNSQNEEQLRQALNDSGFDMDYVRRLAEEQFINRIIFRTELADSFEMTESHIQEYYENHSERYSTEAQVNISQIAFDYSESQKEVVRSVARDALERINNGEDFDQVYRDMTPVAGDDATANIGMVEMDSLRPDLRTELEKMEVGQVSDIIDLGQLFVIVRLEDRQEAEMIPLEQIRNRVRADIQTDVVQDGLDDVILRYKREFLIDVKSPEFEALYDPNSTIRAIQDQS